MKKRKPRPAIVYTLRDHEGNVRYVGCTIHSFNPLIRLQQHRHCKKTAVGRWVRSQVDAGLPVTIHVEERFARYGLAAMAEAKYIAGYRRLLGDVLLNRCGPRKSLLSVSEVAFA